MLLILLATFSIAFSATEEEEDLAPQVRIMVQMWKDIQTYVDTHEFEYWYNNQHHVDYIVKNIFHKYGITKDDDFFIAVMGDPTGKPIAVMVIIKYGGEQYSKNFMIKNVKVNCDDPGNCA